MTQRKTFLSLEGVEVAGDLLDSRPANSEGKVILLTPGDRLLLDQEPEYSENALQQLKKIGGEVICGERAISPMNTTVSDSAKITVNLESGKTMECNVFLPAYCRGLVGGTVCIWISS